MIDLSNCTVVPNTYDGGGTKFPIVYNGRRYILKFTQDLESDPKKPMQGSYLNVHICEHLGSSIFNILGIPAQETFLGTYCGHKVVACKDFIYERGNNDFELVEFKKLETSILGSPYAGGRTPAYENICNIIEHHPQLAQIREEAYRHYWEIIIGDALIGNFDRHAGNWGYILDKNNNQLTAPAPVYDCGSSLYPKLSEATMETLLMDENALKERIMTFPLATLKVNDKKVYYHDFLMSQEGAKCREVLVDILPNWNLDAIQALIFETSGLDSVQREFYSTLLRSRYDNILIPAYEKALEEQINKNIGDDDVGIPSL